MALKPAVIVALVLVVIVVAGLLYWYFVVAPPKPTEEIPDKITVGLTLGLSGSYSYASHQRSLGDSSSN